jgi:hypothetical protein
MGCHPAGLYPICETGKLATHWLSRLISGMKLVELDGRVSDTSGRSSAAGEAKCRAPPDEAVHLSGR